MKRGIERDLALFCVSSIVSQTGDWVLLLALPFFVYGRTHSVIATGGLVTAQLLPKLLVSPFAGVLADRWNRKWSMVGADLFRAGLLLAVLVPAASGPIWPLYLVVLLEASAAQLFVASQGALLPGIVPRERLLGANSMLSTGTAAVRLVGPPLGGLLYAMLGLGTSGVADSLSFVVSGLALLAVRVPSSTEQGPTPARPAFLPALAEGARAVAANRIVLSLCVTLSVVMVSQGALQTVLVPFVRDVLHFDASRFGLLAAAQGLGSLLGALAAGAAGRSLASGRVVGGSLLLAALLLAGFILARSLALSAAFLLLLSVPIVVAAVWIQTCYQQEVSGEMLGRVIGLTETTSAAGVLAGVVAASLLSVRLGIVALLLASAALLALTGAVAVVALWNARTAVREPMSTVTGAVTGGVE